MGATRRCCPLPRRRARGVNVMRPHHAKRSRIKLPQPLPLPVNALAVAIEDHGDAVSLKFETDVGPQTTRLSKSVYLDLAKLIALGPGRIMN